MSKRLVIKTGEYTNGQGKTKGEYTRLGVMMDGDNGPYLLLDPCVNLAGCLTKQNMMSHSKGGKVRSSLMVSVFEEDTQQRPQGQQQQDYRGHTGSNQANPTYEQGQTQGKSESQQASDDFPYDDDIPF